MANRDITESGVQEVLRTMGIPTSFQGLQQGITGRAEALATIGTNMGASAVGGIRGLAELARTGNLSQAVDMINQTQQALTYMPRSQAGIETLQSYAPAMEALGAPSEYVGEQALELTGSPAVATGAEIFGDPYNFIPGLKGIAATVPLARKVMKGSKFADTSVKVDIDVPQEALDSAAEEAIRAFHGSPYDFEKFDWSKIGTGEGAQAYGYGLYFAEVEDVAETYKQAPKVLDGFDNFAMSKEADSYLYDLSESLIKSDPLLSDAISELRYGDFPPDVIKRKMRDFDDDYTSEEIEAAIGRFDDVLKDIDKKFSGKMYEVTIKAKPGELLDFDKPYSEQPKKVQEALKTVFEERSEQIRSRPNIYNRPVEEVIANQKGSDLYDRLAETDEFARFMTKELNAGRLEMSDSMPKMTSKYLESKGIKGIRYDDGLSRGKEGGTSNFVVFDPRIIEIARKYGVALPVAGYILSQIEGQQQQQQPGA